jgi:hypothetical protein
VLFGGAKVVVKLNISPIAIALVALCCSSVEAFADSSVMSANGSRLTALTTIAQYDGVGSDESKLSQTLQRSKKGHSTIQYGFDLASGHTGPANGTLVSLRGGLSSVSRKAAAAGVELTVVW